MQGCKLWESRIHGLSPSPIGTLGLALAASMDAVVLELPGCVLGLPCVCNVCPRATLWSLLFRERPENQSPCQYPWKEGWEGKMNILKVDSVFICKAQGLTKMVWTQPKKYRSRLVVLLGPIWMKGKGAAWWHHLSLFTFHLQLLDVPSIRTDFCVFATMRKMAVRKCFPLRNFNLWDHNVGGNYCVRALCRGSDPRLPV